MPNQEPMEQPPKDIEQKLRIMLKNGPDLIEYVQNHIKKYNLPYTVEPNPLMEGGYELKDTLSAGELHLKKFVTVHEETLKMKDNARKMAKTDHDVLITGETGTGKEIIAKSMIGERQGFIKSVNCAGLPEELIESELFGHVKGAFTGAGHDKQGLMTAAENGILFMDEVGELPLQVQAKLLRALQEKKIRKVGANVEEDISCKFVCATHRNLKEMVENGLFRKDLYARISTLELDILPLRDRLCDLVPITESLPESKKFLETHTADLKVGNLDISLNVRSLQQHVIRFNVLGIVKRITDKEQ